jgi:hypothetical protein
MLCMPRHCWDVNIHRAIGTHKVPYAVPCPGNSFSQPRQPRLGVAEVVEVDAHAVHD